MDTALDRIEEAINEDILAMTPEEVLEEAKSEGEDTAAFAQRMNVWLAAVEDVK